MAEVMKVEDPTTGLLIDWEFQSKEPTAAEWAEVESFLKTDEFKRWAEQQKTPKVDIVAPAQPTGDTNTSSLDFLIPERSQSAQTQTSPQAPALDGAEKGLLTHDGLPAVKNADGSYSTEISITVTDPRLNNGAPTNIPSLWGGKVVDEDTAVANAVRSGNTYQPFASIEAAVAAAKARSDAGGAGAGPQVSAASPAQPNPDQTATDPEAALIEGARNDTPVRTETPARGADAPVVDAAADPEAALVEGARSDTPVRTEPPKDLGIPHTRYFEALSDNKFLTNAQKQEIIDQKLAEWRSSPDYENPLLGKESYKGYRIPVYWVDFDGKVKVANSAVAEGIEDGAKFMAILAGDIVDYARKPFTDVTDENSVGTFLDKYFSQYKETRLGSGLVKEGAGMLVGGGAAVKLTGWMTQFVKNAPKLVGALKGASIAVGTTGAMDPTSSGLFVGKDALFKGVQQYFPILQGLNPDEGAESYEQRMQNRFALLAEGGTIGFAAEGTIKGTIAASKLMFTMSVGGLFSVAGVGQRSVREQAVVREITDRLIAAEGAQGAARERFVRDLAETIKANQQIIMEMDKDVFGTLTSSQTTMNAFLLGVEKGDMEAVANTLSVARRLQQGAIARGGQTAANAGNTVRAADESLTRAQGNLGGQEGVEAATQKIQTDAINQVNAAQGQVADLTARLNSAEAALKTAVTSDPTLGNVLKSIQTRTGIDLVDNNGRLMDNIAERVKNAYVSLKGQRQAVYAEIKGGVLDVDGLVKQLRDMEPATLSTAAGALPDGPLKRMMQMVAERPKSKMVDGKQVAKTAEELAADEAAIRTTLSKELEAIGVTDYGSFFQNVRPTLAQVKDDLFTAGRGGDTRALGAARTFEDFVKFVDGTLLDSTQDIQLLEKVSKAIEWDKANYVPYFRGRGPLSDIARAYDENIAGKGAADAVKDTADWATFNTVATNAIQDNLGQRTRWYGSQIVELLKRPEGGGSADGVYKWIINETLGPLNATLKRGGELTPEITQDAINSLSTYATMLRREFPAEADKIRVLQNDILTNRGNIRSLEKALEEAKIGAAAIEEELFKVRLSEFFGQNGIPKQNAQKVWDSLIDNFNSANDVGRFKSLAEGIFNSQDPLLIRGMQAAYLSRVQRKFFTATKTADGTPVMSLAKLGEEESVGRYLEGLQIVFKDKPEVAETMINVLAVAGNEQARAVRTVGLSVGSDTAFKQQRLRDLNSVVTILLGPLNRTGAKARAIGTKLINKSTNAEAYNDVVDVMMSNPAKFAEVLETIIAKDYKAPSDLMEVAITAFVKAGMVDAERGEELKGMDKTLFNTMVQSESALNETIYNNREKAKGAWNSIKDTVANWLR